MKNPQNSYQQASELQHFVQQNLLNHLSLSQWLITLTTLIAVTVVGMGIIFSQANWMLLAYPMLMLGLVIYWKQIDQEVDALRKYMRRQSYKPNVHIPGDIQLVFTFFGLSICEIPLRLFLMMCLALGSQLIAMIMYMYNTQLPQAEVAFLLLNSMGIIFTVVVLCSRSETNLIHVYNPFQLPSARVEEFSLT